MANTGLLWASLKMLPYNQTPVTELELPDFRQTDVRLFIKREYLNHPFASGNKWWKLKYNLAEAVSRGHRTLLTFGGAYSNHIYATASAAASIGLKSVGVIRGERTLPLNATLRFAEEHGMTLHHVSRDSYRRKMDAAFIQELRSSFGNFYLIPEGGTNALALTGAQELGDKLSREIDFNYLCLPVGTGGTLAGLAKALPDKTVIGFSSLKGGDYLSDEVAQWVGSRSNWRIETDYHFGGYGKISEELRSFTLGFERQYDVPLDPVYTAKAMFGIFDLLKKGRFARKSKVLFLHTGGLQGRGGFNF